MRTRDEMLKDANTARNGYAYLKNSEDALPVRLGQDVTNLLAALAEKDAEIGRMANVVEYCRVAGNVRNEDIKVLRVEIARLKADLAQFQAALTNLSREIWKVC